MRSEYSYNITMGCHNTEAVVLGSVMNTVRSNGVGMLEKYSTASEILISEA